MSHSLLLKLRIVLKSLDDDALAALANKGLLRRAAKDLETARPVILGVDEDFIRIQLGGETVSVPESPAKSTCSCPATGICRHILSALLYLRDDEALAAADVPVQTTLFSEDIAAGDYVPPDTQAATSLTLATAEEVLGNLTDDDLQRWAGKSAFQKAMKSLGEPLESEIEVGLPLVIRFPIRNISCRWIPSGGLHGMICSCRSPGVCDHVVAAVLAYQVFLGRRQIVVVQQSLQESSGAPRTRAEILASVGLVLRELVTLGLARHSMATVQRLVTLAVSAHGVDLPRLERMLKSLADEIQLALRRNAQANSANLLLAAARCEALRVALVQNPTVALVGQHRTQYQEVGQLTLIGLGAQHWQSKGGYRGLTLYFWDESRRAFATWSDTRPSDQAYFDPVSRFQADGPWNGCTSPSEASRHAIRLIGAFRNSQGRISGRASTSAMVLDPSSIESIPNTIADWSEIAGRFRRLFGMGLSDNVENLQVAILRPAHWLPGYYDSLRQELTRTILDPHGKAIQLWLPFTAENGAAIEFLERYDPKGVLGVLGAIRWVAGRACVQPISLLEREKIISLNLDLDIVKPKQPASQLPALSETDPEVFGNALSDTDESSDNIAAAARSPVGRLLIAVQAELENIAESGTSVRRDLGVLNGAANRFEAIGLSTCAKPLAHLVSLLTRSATDPNLRNESAGRLLWSYYLLQLAATHETISIACGGMS